MMNIGAFARLGGVSIRMLRHYDQLGLLVPSEVDPHSGYRRYAAAQLQRLNRLIALKDLGFTLEQVGPILDAEVGPAELRGMLTLRRAQLAAQIDADRARLDAIEQRLRTIEGEGQMSDLEFVGKSLPALHVAQLTATVADTSEISAFMDTAYPRLMAALDRAQVRPVGPPVAWYDGSDDGLRIAAAFPVPAGVEPVEGLDIADLPATERAQTVIHHGPMTTIGASWQALVRHVEDTGRTPAGICREVYLDMPPDRADWVTELQQPIA